ncbi:MAG: hypothetical protein BWK80_00175 [Desulfobacteraceae bacterium IS3]|nr:MAG: hypothetical protein BWK80_00175 [Desulfobacteraceae bacterium IS3]
MRDTASNNILELFGYPTESDENRIWDNIISDQICLFTHTRCFKVRKSQPEISIGTCAVKYGRDKKNIIICPNRLLERKQVFTDCLQLLSLHEPGNELHVVSEISVPGGSVDYFLVSARDRKVKDFAAIEFQTLDTTGTVWPERQRLLSNFGITLNDSQIQSSKTFGMNWKMTAKTILVQLHHKIETFENVNKHLVLIVQDCLLEYMSREFNFDHLHSPARIGDSMHIHSYSLKDHKGFFRLDLNSRLSTDANGISVCLGLQTEARVELDHIIKELEKKISENTLLTIG